jgi:hypothetical protein
MRPKRALSIRQPFAELIMTGKKKHEYRNIPTNIRERVYVYASNTPGPLEAASYELVDTVAETVLNRLSRLGCAKWLSGRASGQAESLQSSEKRGEPSPILH